MIMCGFVIRAILSFPVRLSCLFCLRFSVSNISIVILCRNVSKAPLLVNLIGDFLLKPKGVSRFFVLFTGYGF